MRPESSGVGIFMNMKVGLAVLSVLLAAGLLAACSPVRLLNALTPSYTFSLFAGIPYGSGERHVLDVYLPTRVLHHWPADASAGAPVVVFFTAEAGSPASARTICSWERRSRRGFCCRLTRLQDVSGDYLPGFVDDAAQAVAWAREHAVAFGGDPRRLFLMGHSAGAQIAALLATDGRYLAAQEMRKSDIAGVIGLAGAYDFLPLRDPTLERIFPKEARAASQPIRFIQGTEPPMWLAVAENDTVVGRQHDPLRARAARQGRYRRGHALQEREPCVDRRCSGRAVARRGVRARRSLRVRGSHRECVECRHHERAADVVCRSGSCFGFGSVIEASPHCTRKRIATCRRGRPQRPAALAALQRLQFRRGSA